MVGYGVLLAIPGFSYQIYNFAEFLSLSFPARLELPCGDRHGGTTASPVAPVAGVAINTKPVEGGRSGGSLAWAGIYNTFFWIDPPRKTCAVILMQILPFGDDEANSVVEHFERAVYASPARAVAAGGRSH